MASMRSMFGRKKRRLTFEVGLVVHELSHIPFAAGDVFVKWKLPGSMGRSGSSGLTEAVRIRDDHTARWGKRFPAFNVTLSVDDATNMLDPLILRLSVRVNTTASMKHTRLGVVLLDLAEYAGTAKTCRKCLLQESDVNSSLRVTVYMEQKKGDPMFRSRAPTRGVVASDDGDDDDGDGSGTEAHDDATRTRRHGSLDGASVVTGGAGAGSTVTASVGGVDPMLLRGLRAGATGGVGGGGRGPEAMLRGGLRPDNVGIDGAGGGGGSGAGGGGPYVRRGSSISHSSTQSSEESPRSRASRDGTAAAAGAGGAAFDMSGSGGMVSPTSLTSTESVGGGGDFDGVGAVGGAPTTPRRGSADTPHRTAHSAIDDLIRSSLGR